MSLGRSIARFGRLVNRAEVYGSGDPGRIGRYTINRALAALLRPLYARPRRRGGRR